MVHVWTETSLQGPVLCFHLVLRLGLSCFCHVLLNGEFPPAEPPVSTFYLTTEMLGFQMSATAPGFLCGFWRSNSSHQPVLRGQQFYVLSHFYSPQMILNHLIYFVAMFLFSFMKQNCSLRKDLYIDF